MNKIVSLFTLALLATCLLSACSDDDAPMNQETPTIGAINSARCPDGNHPHAIDLGLPSGTKWACCNVEAKMPGDLGGHYAWGETKEKSEYTLDTYTYHTVIDNKDIYAYLGEDIGGTQYDVAHVKMGATWRMPTLAQMKELLDCEWTWSVEYDSKDYGMSGYAVKGKNGSTIFLPAAGYLWHPTQNGVGSHGRYWCSQPYPNSSLESYAYILSFYSTDFVSWLIDSKERGFSVRAVCE